MRDKLIMLANTFVILWGMLAIYTLVSGYYGWPGALSGSLNIYFLYTLPLFALSAITLCVVQLKLHLKFNFKYDQIALGAFLVVALIVGSLPASFPLLTGMSKQQSELLEATLDTMRERDYLTQIVCSEPSLLETVQLENPDTQNIDRIKNSVKARCESQI